MLKLPVHTTPPLYRKSRLIPRLEATSGRTTPTAEQTVQQAQNLGNTVHPLETSLLGFQVVRVYRFGEEPLLSRQAKQSQANTVTHRYDEREAGCTTD